MPRYKISAATQQKVRQRANYLCEYCHTAEQWQYVPFTIDHVIPVDQGGHDSFDNLALACFHCNRRKSNALTAIDPLTNKTVPLFNPRQHSWNEHFAWSVDGLRLIGHTEIGRATIQLLNFNRERIIRIRAADVLVSRHPPKSDPMQEKSD